MQSCANENGGHSNSTHPPPKKSTIRTDLASSPFSDPSDRTRSGVLETTLSARATLSGGTKFNVEAYLVPCFTDAFNAFLLLLSLGVEKADALPARDSAAAAADSRMDDLAMAYCNLCFSTPRPRPPENEVVQKIAARRAAKGVVFRGAKFY